jgi:D-glycero-D-manno-heptose 1,7-bisphosphate phosphatase
MRRPAVFLDRDGTLIEEAGYINRIDRMIFYPYSLDSVRLLSRSGFRIIVITNQAGVARGYLTEEFVHEAHRYLTERIREAGGEVDGFYYCPHHTDASVAEYRVDCDCRKPKPGMFVAAAREHDLDLSKSFGVGDRWHDVNAAQAAGATSLMVLTGYGETELRRPTAGLAPAYIASTLIEATTWILQHRVC